MNRSDAKMIAEELHKFIRNDVRKAVTEMATAETEEYLNAKQAAVFLGWKLQTLYNRIHDIPHTKNGKSLIFTKSALRNSWKENNPGRIWPSFRELTKRSLTYCIV